MMRSLNRIFPLAAVFAFLVSGAGHASPVHTVVELFTSQGCSSCPPADQILRDLRDRDGILALSWPVDYWDRFGWKDTFAQPGNTERQAAYNKRLGMGGVFTPQMVFNGAKSCVGSRAKAVNKGLETVAGMTTAWVEPTVQASGTAIMVDLPDAETTSDVIVRIVYYTADADVMIGNGENRGRTLHYANVVRATEIVGIWSGSAQSYTLDREDAKLKGADHVAVLLQAGNRHGQIVGAIIQSL